MIDFLWKVLAVMGMISLVLYLGDCVGCEPTPEQTARAEMRVKKYKEVGKKLKKKWNRWLDK